MAVEPWVWWATIILVTGFLLFDVFVVGRRPHIPSMKECATYLIAYIGMAVIFGLGVWYFSGGRYAGEFFAGWLTEYSLSIDNLFVFILIMARFNVDRRLQQSALLIGIVLALIFRAIFIALGAVAIEQFSWVFYIFGAFLIYTALKLSMEGESEDEEFEEGRVTKWIRGRFPMTEGFEGTAAWVRRDGKLLLTPMFLVIVALGVTDLLFAMDSIPAIYGLTQEPYLVFTANLFALMGLRQLYFLIGELLQRLIYLSIGLAVLLGFIGFKLLFHAMHVNELPFINDGKPIKWAPEISITTSLSVIFGILIVTTVASLIVSRRRDLNAAQ